MGLPVVRVLVGTLHTMENEFEMCKQSVFRQQGVQWSHFVLSNHSDKEGHEALYGHFMAMRSQYDYFVKLDADMVLRKDTVIRDAVLKLNALQEADLLVVGVHDFFLDATISGLHVYRSSVEWPSYQDSVFTDQPPMDDSRIHHCPAEMSPCVTHCENPNILQCYRWGMHRAIKLIAALGRQDLRRAKGHLRLLGMLSKRLISVHDQRLALACSGAVDTLRGQWGLDALNAANPLVASRACKIASQSYIRDHAKGLSKLLSNLRSRLHAVKRMKQPWVYQMQS